MIVSINKSGHSLIWPDRILVFIGKLGERKTGSIIAATADHVRNEYLARTEGVVVEIGKDAFANSSQKPKPKDLVCFPQHSASSVVEGDDGALYFVLKDTSINTIHKR